MRVAPGAGIDLSQAPADGRDRAIFVDSNGRLCYREGPVQYLKRLTAFLSAAGASERLRCPPDEAARVLFGITQATFLPWILESDVEVTEPARHASHVVDLFLRGAGRPDGT